MFNFPISHWLGTVEWPQTWVLFRTQGTHYYCINQVSIFHWQFGILGNVILPWCYSSCSFYPSNMLYLLEGPLLVFIFKLRHQLPNCQGCQCHMNWGIENSEDCMRLLWTQKSFHISWPHKDLFMIIDLSASHFSIYSINPCRTAQPSAQMINSQVLWAVKNKTVLSSVLWLLWLVSVSIQMVSVLG